MKELDEVSILSLNENYNDSESSIKDYLENKIVMYHNFNQIKLQEKYKYNVVVENEFFILEVNKKEGI